jgi:DNA-binding beta-propeller fold protein YncE
MSAVQRLTLTVSPRALAACAALACSFMLLASANALAGEKGVVSVLGGTSSGVGAAQFNAPSGIALNQSTGDVYVADSANNRIQEFAADGSFIGMWGVGVSAAGPDAKPVTDEVKSVVVSATTASSFQLTFGGFEFFNGLVFGGETTSAIPVGAPAASVEAALQALPAIGGAGGLVSVTGSGTEGSPYLMTFGGTLGGVKNVLGTSFLGTNEGVTVTVSTVTAAAAPFERCVAANGDTCRAGVADAQAGGMAEPQGVAVDQTTGNVYVTDQGNHRVDAFSATGEFEGAWGWGVSSGAEAFEFCTAPSSPAECQAGRSGSGAGQFGGTIGYPAVDPTSGDVYVADSANGRVDEFSVTTTGGAVSNAAFVHAYGWGVATGAEEFQVCTSTCGAALTGIEAGQFSGGAPTSVAVDGGGDVYALDAGRIQKFDSAGQPMANFATGSLRGQQSPAAVAVNPSDNHVLVVQPCDPTICPGASPTAELIFDFDSGGSLRETNEVDPGVSEVKSGVGLAVSVSSGSIYLTSAKYSREGVQRLLTLNPIVAPTAAVESASGVTADTAVLHGTVNPGESVWNQLQTLYQFEYSADGSTWTKVGAPGKLNASMSPLTVEETVTGLESRTTYQVRLHAEKEFAGGSAISESTEFTTASTAPTVSGASAGDVEANTALLQAQVNPQGADTTYRFEYGTSEAYGAALPLSAADVGSNVGDVAVSAHLEGLVSGTPYYYRVVASNAHGTGEARGVFTTHALAPPAVVTGEYGALAQNGATISGTLDTEGLPTTYGFEVGTSTSYGPPTGLGSVGAGASEALVSLALNGLQPGTTYHYRITASNVDGTSVGLDRTFTTATFPDVFAAPPAPLPFVAVPSIAFPGKPSASKVKPKPTKKPKKAKRKKSKKSKKSKRHKAAGKGSKKAKHG